MDELKHKLLNAMNQRNFGLQDLMKIVFDEVNALEQTVESQSGQLSNCLLLEIEQRDEIKRLKNTILELEAGNQNNIEFIEKWTDIAGRLNETVKTLAWELIWAERE